MLKKHTIMTVSELKEIIANLPEEYDDLDVVFGSAYSGMPVETVEMVSGEVEIGI